MKINKYTWLVFVITFILFVIPFFWLKPGEMDLGGDSNRLYFYDPISNLKAFAIYSVVPWGVSIIAYNQYFIPFLLFITFLKSIFNSPTIVIAILNGLKLAGSFLFVFLILKEMFLQDKKEKMTLAQFTAAILGALFYTFSPSVVDNMKYALVTHSQVFLNPMIFYCILKYLISSSMKYIWFALFVTLIFSSSFALYNPPLFSFYSLAIVFLLFYNFLILKKSIPWKGIIIGVLFFLGLHAFHLIPVASNVFDKGSELSTRTFEGATNANSGLEYFNAIRGLGKVSDHILLPLENKQLSLSLIIIPVLVMLGFLSLKRKSKTLLLVSIFFLTTLFLVSANITQIGVEFYRKLFLIPGFGMFRNFYGQWQWVYTFFYALLAGLSISYAFSKIKKRYVFIVSTAAIGLLMLRSIIVFNGDIVNVFHRGSKNVKVVMRMDPNYEKVLDYIKKISNDGRILHMPFTDFAYNIVGGQNKGVYIGQSMVSFLAGRNDFAGYQNIDPFSEVFRKLSHEKKYSLIKQMMSMLQIRYVLYNSDEIVSAKFFPTFPYGYVGTPAFQSALLEFVDNISEKKIYEADTYSLFEVDKKQYTPHFYVASEIFIYDTNPKYDVKYSRALSFFPQEDLNREDPRIAYLDRVTCNRILTKQICDQNSYKPEAQNIQIAFQGINPTKYKIEITRATKPFLLVFQSEFSSYWKLFPAKTPLDGRNIADSYFDGDVIELARAKETFDKNPFETNELKSIYGNTHVQINGYSNAWYVNPSETTGKEKYEFIVEMTAQKKVYYSVAVSLMTLPIFVLWGLTLLFKKKNHA